MKRAILGALAAALLTGCTTVNPVTGVRAYDPIKTAQVKASVEPIVASVVRRVASEKNEVYIRAVGVAFCAVSTSGQLSPVTMMEIVDAATFNLQQGVDPTVIDAKNLLVALYKINYGDRFTAELPPDKWPKNVADVICNAIDQGLKDKGLAGVK